MEPLRIGILGAARITSEALIKPAQLTGHHLVAVAARDPQRAQEFAASNGIDRVVGSYRDLVNDPDIEAIYNPLPNGLHGPWNIEAMRAGKHVLSEKPSASNATEARAVAAVQSETGQRFMEAFHYRYHPVMRRMVELAGNGEIGDIEHVEVVMGFPLNDPDDPRWEFDLAGGAMMDLGCYAIHGIRSLGEHLGGEPRVTAATAVPREVDPRVDEELSGDLVYPSGTTAHFRSSFVLPEVTMTMHLRGTKGEALAHQFCVSGLDPRITIVSAGESRTEHLPDRTTYTYQLDAFADYVRNGTEIFTDAEDAVIQSQMMDDCYEAAGLPLRPTIEL